MHNSLLLQICTCMLLIFSKEIRYIYLLLRIIVKIVYILIILIGKGKAVPLQAWTCPEGSY